MTRLTAEQRILRAVPESAWQRQVEDMLALAGFDLVNHVHDSRRDRRGFPDLLAIRKRGICWMLVVCELKTETGRVRPEQECWLKAWRGIASVVNGMTQTVRVVVGVFRPRDAERLWETIK